MKTIIIGGGPAGMMAAVSSLKENNTVLLFERNEKLGNKLLLTGHGQCNVTNACDPKTFLSKVNSNPRFLNGALHSFSSEDMVSFLHEQGIETIEKDNHRIFPKSLKAQDILSCFENLLKKAEIHTNEMVLSLLIKDNTCIGIKTSKGNYYADSIILCTGGKSFPVTGSDGFGYSLAQQAHHTLIPCQSALCALEIQEDWVKDCQGLSLKNIILKQGKIKEQGDLLFTHFGISGPLVLNTSSLLKKGNLTLDLCPDYSFEELEETLIKKTTQNKQLQNACSFLFPSRLLIHLFELCQINGRNTQFTKKERRKFIETCKNCNITIKEKRNFKEAMVTKGGISTKEINPKTMESKLCVHLKFAGEIIDVDAQSGGFNLQIAWSTGYVAGKNQG